MTTENLRPRAFLLLGQAGERQFHNTPDHWAHLSSIMRELELEARVISDDVGDLNSANLARFDVILNYSTGLEASTTQIDALLEAIRRGIGFVGLHAASATFKSSEQYFDMIGGRFVRHPPFGRFTVEILERDHPITAGLIDFEIEDERYELGDLADGIDVLAQNDGHPMVFTSRYGAGRVAYIALGHDARSLGRPEYHRLVGQAIDWAAQKR
jgi:type 1 glutamine amidotransferase